MTEITTIEEWLKAANHCVLKHWRNTDSWLWDAHERKRCRPNTQCWKWLEMWKAYIEHYDWMDPVHTAVYNALMFHLEPDQAPKDRRAPEWSSGRRPKNDFIQGMERLIDCEPEMEPEVVGKPTIFRTTNTSR